MCLVAQCWFHPFCDAISSFFPLVAVDDYYCASPLKSDFPHLIKPSSLPLSNPHLQSPPGMVRIKLYKGNVVIVGRKSAFSLYDDRIASFEDDQGAYDQKDAAGFIKLQVHHVAACTAVPYVCGKHSPLLECFDMPKCCNSPKCVYNHQPTGAASAYAGYQSHSSQGQWRASRQTLKANGHCVCRLGHVTHTRILLQLAASSFACCILHTLPWFFCITTSTGARYQ